MREIPVDLHDDRVRTVVLAWDRRNAEEVERARRKFEEYMEKGWVAFEVTPENRKVQVYRFNPKLEKIVLAALVEGG